MKIDIHLIIILIIFSLSYVVGYFVGKRYQTLFKICPICKGLGYIEKISDENVLWKRTERIKCNLCDGKGSILK